MHSAQTHISPATASAPRFEDLLRLHYHQCVAFARRMSGNREEAEDLTQEAFYRAYRGFGRYDPRRPFERWVFWIIANLFVDRLRARGRATVYSLDALAAGQAGENLALELPDTSHDPARCVLADVMDERLVSALAQLPDAFRQTVLLVDVQEMSYEEAAQRLGCAVGTVRSRVHRARQQLRAMLTSEAR